MSQREETRALVCPLDQKDHLYPNAGKRCFLLSLLFTTQYLGQWRHKNARQ